MQGAARRFRSCLASAQRPHFLERDHSVGSKAGFLQDSLPILPMRRRGVADFTRCRSEVRRDGGKADTAVLFHRDPKAKVDFFSREQHRKGPKLVVTAK